jgi:L-asparaginase
MDSHQKRSGRVLVILTGGNVTLISAPDRRQNEVLLNQCSLAQLRSELLGSENADTITLQEGSLLGKSVHIDFEDLREDEDQKYHDPEELDSSQVKPKLWAQLVRTVKDKYDSYEGFVILHGLDTMAYTASALSFMLQRLNTPVVLTGAQRPLNFKRTDAVQNIFTAITFAAAGTLEIRPIISGVSVYSYDTLFRGSRTSMCSATAYRSFDSPNFPALATVGDHIDIQSHLVRSDTKGHVISTKDKVDARVVILDVYPGMDAAMIEGLRRRRKVKTTDTGKEEPDESKPIRGVLLRTYGMGTAPTSESVLGALRELSDSEIVVMNVTQARSGRISHGQDSISLRLFEQGVISGVDMTAEAAYAKMVVQLSEGDDFKERADLLQIEASGEQSQSIFHIHFDANETTLAENSQGTYRALLRKSRDVVEASRILHNLDLVDHIQLRLLGLEPSQEKDKDRNWSTEIDISLVETTGAGKIVAPLPHDTLRWFAEGRATINKSYDITGFAKQLIGDRIPATWVLIESHQPIRWRRASIAIFSHVERSGERSP